jgi:uncharacterized protein
MHIVGFTPGPALLGGTLMGLGLALILISSGRLAGLSGIVAGMLWPGDRDWRLFFVIGMLGVGATVYLVSPTTFDAAQSRPIGLIVVAGLLVGFGTRVGNGCTTGHGFCGLSRGSKRSFVAMMTFFMVAVATATLYGVLGGAS